MTGKEVLEYLMNEGGLDEATAKAVMANEKITSKAGNLVQKQEYDKIAGKAAELEASLNKAKTYEEWYSKNHASLQALLQRQALYEERFGPIENAPQNNQTQNNNQQQFKPEDVKRMVAEAADKHIQERYAPQWSNLLVNSASLVERHMRANRKNSIDWKKIEELAAAKGGDLNAAYEEWDKPEREAAAKDATEKEIQRRVKEEMAKQNTQGFFPAAADAGGSKSPLSRDRSTAPVVKAEPNKPTYDRNKVIEAAMNPDAFKAGATVQ